jgi:hypothetical protein
MVVPPAAPVNTYVPLGGTRPDLRFFVPNNRTETVTEMATAPILTVCHFL